MSEDTLRIAVRLTPKAARAGVQGWSVDTNGAPVLKAGVTAVPEKGKANAALVALLAKTWGIPKSAITIVRGDTDRNKILEISGMSAAQKDSILSDMKKAGQTPGP